MSNGEDDAFTLFGLRSRARRTVRCRGPVFEVPTLVPESRGCAGHEERVRAHAERVAREETRSGDRYGQLVCDACGTVAPRAGNVRAKGGENGARWVCRQLLPGINEVYCRGCVDLWGLPESEGK